MTPAKAWETMQHMSDMARPEQARIAELQAEIARTREAWRRDGLRMQEQIQRHRLALRYIAGEEIEGWDADLDPRDVARDELARPE